MTLVSNLPWIAPLDLLLDHRPARAPSTVSLKIGNAFGRFPRAPGDWPRAGHGRRLSGC